MVGTQTKAANACAVIAKVFADNGGNDYIGEPISIIEHSLQAASLARAKFPNDTELHIAALLHDVGHMLGTDEQSETADMDGCGVMHHEELGAQFALKLGLSERVANLIRSHVAAKRYLCWKSPEYHAKLSDASKTTLKFQGGPMNDMEGEEWERSPDLKLYIAMRKWDEAAKVKNLKVARLESYFPVIEELVSSGGCCTTNSLLDMFSVLAIACGVAAALVFAVERSTQATI
eukprot:m.54955 g.54955  ORF g.54955 m.54955 type:complete len:233 (-) comp21998_c0_seq2:175-873(-)